MVSDLKTFAHKGCKIYAAKNFSYGFFKSDWYLLLQSDFDKMNIVLDEKEVENANVLTFKQSIKTSVWHAFSKVFQRILEIRLQLLAYPG